MRKSVVVVQTSFEYVRPSLCPKAALNVQKEEGIQNVSIIGGEGWLWGGQGDGSQWV